MAKHDYRSPPPTNDATYSNYAVAPHVRLAKQILYDVGSSQPRDGDEVVRNEKADDDRTRHTLGLNLALVYLVGRLDCELCRAFRLLWKGRRDLLEGWAADRFGSAEGEDSAVADEEQPRKRQRDRSPPQTTFPVPFADVWSPSTSKLTLEEFVLTQAAAEWDGMRVKKKIEVLTKRILKDLEQPASQVLDHLYVGLSHRNVFAHPKPVEEKPRKIRPSLATRSEETARDPSQAEFDAFCEALLKFIDWLNDAVGHLSTSWIASNYKRCDDLLSDRQLLALGAYHAASGRLFESVERLFREIEESCKKGRPPALMLLVPNKELAPRLEDALALAAKHKVSLIFFHAPFNHLDGDEWTLWKQFVDNHQPAPPKRPRTDRAPELVGLQRLPGFRVVHRDGLCFDRDGRPIEIAPHGQKFTKRVPFDQYDPVDALEAAVEEVTRIPQGRRRSS